MYLENRDFIILQSNVTHSEAFQQPQGVNTEILTWFSFVYFALFNFIY